jgi:uncharacterized membrane protein YvbJ
VLLYKQQQQKANEDIYNDFPTNYYGYHKSKGEKRVAQELHDGVLGECLVFV